MDKVIENERKNDIDVDSNKNENYNTNIDDETKKDNKNIKFGIILSYISLFVSILGTTFITNKVVNFIGYYNYGLYTFVNSIITWLTIISSALSASFVRFSTIESKNNNGDSAKINTLYWKLFLLLGFFILTVGLSVISILYFNNINLFGYSWNDSKKMYLLFGLSIINISLNIPSQLFSLYVSYKKKFIFAKILSIGVSVLTFLGHFFIAYITKNVVYIAAFSIFTTIITFIVSYIYCKKSLSIKFIKSSLKSNKTLIKNIIIFSGIIILNTIVDQINSAMDKTLLGIFSTPENVTKYQLGYGFYSYLVIMATSISAVYVPTIHSLVYNNEKSKIDDLYLSVSKTQAIILCFITFGFLSCGKEFIFWWIGNENIETFIVATVLFVLNIGPLTMNLSIEIQRAMNKHKFRAWIYFVCAILNISLSILFLILFPAKYSIIACLIGTVISKIVSHWIAMNIYNKKIIKLPVQRQLLQLTKYVVIAMIPFLLTTVLFTFINLNVGNLILFLIKGCVYVLLFLVVIILIDKQNVKTLIKKRSSI